MGIRRNLLFGAVVLAMASSFGSPAAANDSSALLASGGIVLTASKDVSMESEDLWISQDLIRVSYVFKNLGPTDVTTEVAFPVPPIPSCDEDHESDCEGDMQIGSFPNPMNFKLAIDGKETAFKTEIKETEKKKGVGAINVIHHWEQVFPKNREVRISHEYVPVAGAFFTDKGGYTEGRFERDMSALYCVGPKLLKVLKRQELYVWVVHYILTTGANWKGPIKNFKLTIVKGSPSSKVSVCLPDTRRVSPTTFVVTRKDFVPTEDLKILFVN